MKQFAERNHNVVDKSFQRNASSWNSNFNYAQQLQQLQQQQHDTDAMKMQFERETLVNSKSNYNENRAFAENAGYKVEILNETMKKSQFSDNFVEHDKECEEKGGKNYDF